MSKNVEDIIKAILDERKYQDEECGFSKVDRSHTQSDWILIMEDALTKAKNACSKEQHDNFLSEVLQLTAVGFACIEHQELVTRKK